MKINAFRGRYKFLSNFYPCRVSYRGIPYPSVEHAYQAAKTLSKSERKRIRNLKTAGEARKAGRSLDLRGDWEGHKQTVMYYLLQQKFNNPKLRTELLETGDAELIEDNWWGDIYWGMCNDKGENQLGKLLMRIRDEIK